jgi:hypothetical protein
MRIRSLVTLGLLLACASTTEAYQRAEVAGVRGRYLYWEERTISYAVNDKGCKDVSMAETLGAIKRSFFAWAGPSCTDIYFVYEGTDSAELSNLLLPQDQKPDSKNLVIWRSSWPPPGVTDAAITKEMPAVTTVIYNTDTGVIVDADIDLNGHDFFWTSTDDQTKVATDIQNIMTHEIGHLLGLGHTAEKEASMFESTHQGELKKRSLHADDELGLCKVYPFGEITPKGEGQGTVPQDVQGGCALAPPTQGNGAVGGLAVVLGFLALLLGPAWQRRRARSTLPRDEACHHAAGSAVHLLRGEGGPGQGQ